MNESNNEESENENEEWQLENAWNHMGIVNIGAEDIVEHHNENVILYGDDLQVTLDVGSNGYDHEHEWVNHAGVQITEDKVILHVSVADPRGAITMSIERCRLGDNDGALTLIVPHENNNLQHIRMTPITLVSQGIFQLGESEWADEMDEKRKQYRAKQAGYYRALVEMEELFNEGLHGIGDYEEAAIRGLIEKALDGGDE